MTDNNETLNPSLREDFEPTKTFNISWFYLISIFLGPICMIFVGTYNAKWLKIKPAVIYGMVAFCITVLFAKYTVLVMAQYSLLGLNMAEHNNIINYTFRALYLLIGLLYATLLKGAYRNHMSTIKTTEKFDSYLIRYGVMSVAIEIALGTVIIGMG